MKKFGLKTESSTFCCWGKTVPFPCKLEEIPCLDPIPYEAH